MVILDCEWAEWSPAQNCSKPCGGGVWRLRRQVVSPDPYCSLDSQGAESWKVEHRVSFYTGTGNIVPRLVTNLTDVFKEN